MLNPENLFWHFLQREEAKLPAPFSTLAASDRAAVLDRIRETIEQILSMGDMGDGSQDHGGAVPGDVVYTTRGGNFSSPSGLVVLGKLLRIEDLPNHDGTHAGVVLVFEGAAVMINFGPGDFVIPAEQMWFNETLVRSAAYSIPPECATSMGFMSLDWVPIVAPFTVPAYELRYVRSAQQPA